MRERVICVMARMLDQDDGLYVYAQHLLEQLLELDSGSRYLIVLPSGKRARQFDRFPNAEVRVVAAPKTLWDQIVVPFVAWRGGADLIFNPKFSLPLVWNRPAAFVLQGSDWYVNPQNYPWWDNVYIRTAMPLYLRKADRVLAISRTVVDDLSPYLRLDRSKIVVSYAAPGPSFTPRRDELALARFREAYALPERFILTVARTYHTGHGRLPAYPGGNNERLVRAYRLYRERGGRLPLVVAGKRVDAYLRARGYEDRELEDIVFTGFVPHERIHSLYQLAELFVLATLNESFCFPLVEAMACGCPAIAPSTGACYEIGGSAIRLVDPFDPESIAEALLELDRSPERRRAMSREGLEVVRRFSWKDTARRTLAVFDALVPPSVPAARAGVAPQAPAKP